MNRIFIIHSLLAALLVMTGCDSNMMGDHPVNEDGARLEIALITSAIAYFNQNMVTLSGRVILCSLNDTGNPNVRVVLDGAFENRTTYTDSNGDFSFNDIRPGDFVLSASRQGYDFVPARQTVALAQSGMSNVNFETMVTWEKTIGGSGWDRAFSIKQDRNDCGYIISGYSDSETQGNFNWHIVKLDMLGRIVANSGNDWVKTFGGTNTDISYCIDQDSDGTFIGAGSSESIENSIVGLSDFWVIKMDGNGTQLWEQTYGSSEWDEARSVITASDGNYIVAGSNASLTGAGLADFWILKLNSSNGNVLWDYSYGTSESNKAFSVLEDTMDGSYIAAGSSNIPLDQGGGSEAAVVKLLSNGNLDWEQNYKNGLYNEAYAVTSAADGYVLAGFTKESDFDNGSVWVVKIPKDGNPTPLWEKKFEYDDISVARSIKSTSDGGFIITGYVLSSESDYDILVIKLNAAGDKQWERFYNGSINREDRAYEIRETSDGGFVLAGYTETISDKDDMWILKLNSEGEIVP